MSCNSGEIAVRGVLAKTAREDIEQAMQSRISGNFFATDLGVIRAALERAIQGEEVGTLVTA